MTGVGSLLTGKRRLLDGENSRSLGRDLNWAR